MNRPLSERDLAYDRLSADWDEVISDYDTGRRVETLVDGFLGAERIRGKNCFDGGCGLGYFTKALLRFHPASVTAVDIAPKIVSRLAEGLPGVKSYVADILDLSPCLGDQTFDVVVSSEVIEHTPDPRRAVRELASRVAPGGFLALSCPNRRWKWLLHLVNAFGLRRHYAGYENWVAPGDLASWVSDAGLQVVSKTGVHTVPWHFSECLVRRIDRFLWRVNYSWSVNLAILAKRPS